MGAKISTSWPEKQDHSVIKDTEVRMLCPATHFQRDFHQLVFSAVCFGCLRASEKEGKGRAFTPTSLTAIPFKTLQLKVQTITEILHLWARPPCLRSWSVRPTWV